jgi:hypothetical protein
MVTIKHDDLSLAFDFVSSGAPMAHRAYLSLHIGRICWISELNPVEEEESPDDLETSDRYLEIPHKNDLDLGRQLVFRFVEEQLPERCDRVAGIFSHRGGTGDSRNSWPPKADSSSGTSSKLRRPSKRSNSGVRKTIFS